MKIHLLPIALFALLVAGCDEEPEQVAPIEDNTDLSCQVSTIESEFNDEDEYYSSVGSSSVSFSYNSDKTISKINSEFSEIYCYVNDGVEDCQTYEYIDEITFIYSNGVITDVTFSEQDEDQEIIEFTYANDKISKMKFFEDGGTDFDEYVFVYNNSGKLEKLENWDNYSGPTQALVLYGYEEFIWTGDNVTTISSFYENSDESSSRILNQKSNSIFGVRAFKKTSDQKQVYHREAPELSYKVTLTYDDKVNPVFGNLPFLLYDGEFYSYLSASNPVTITSTDYEGSESGVETDNFSYSYNEDGFPTIITTGGEETTLTYNCD